MRIKRLFLLFCFCSSQALGGGLLLAQFSQNSLQGWEETSFVGQTEYSLVFDADQIVLKGESHQSASGLIKKIEIDLTRTPILQWRWKIQQEPATKDETIKEGDDYAARIYVAFSTGPFPWQKRVLNYVWSRHQPIGSLWKNAFSHKVLMLALQQGNKKHHSWIQEKRNVFRDIQEIFGLEIYQIEGIALMTDSDNSKSSAIAYYGDIFFSAD